MNAFSIKRMRVKPSFIAFAGLAAIFAVRPLAASERCEPPEGSLKVRLTGLDRHGDPVLANGTVLRLAGLAPRQSETERERLSAAIQPW